VSLSASDCAVASASTAAGGGGRRASLRYATNPAPITNKSASPAATPMSSPRGGALSKVPAPARLHPLRARPPPRRLRSGRRLCGFCALRTGFLAGAGGGMSQLERHGGNGRDRLDFPSESVGCAEGGGTATGGGESARARRTEREGRCARRRRRLRGGRELGRCRRRAWNRSGGRLHLVSGCRLAEHHGGAGRRRRLLRTPRGPFKIPGLEHHRPGGRLVRRRHWPCGFATGACAGRSRRRRRLATGAGAGAPEAGAANIIVVCAAGLPTGTGAGFAGMAAPSAAAAGPSPERGSGTCAAHGEPPAVRSAHRRLDYRAWPLLTADFHGWIPGRLARRDL